MPYSSLSRSAECRHQRLFTDAAATQKSLSAHHHHQSQSRRWRMYDFSTGLYSWPYWD